MLCFSYFGGPKILRRVKRVKKRRRRKRRQSENGPYTGAAEGRLLARRDTWHRCNDIFRPAARVIDEYQMLFITLSFIRVSQKNKHIYNQKWQHWKHLHYKDKTLNTRSKSFVLIIHCAFHIKWSLFKVTLITKCWNTESVFFFLLVFVSL